MRVGEQEEEIEQLRREAAALKARVAEMEAALAEAAERERVHEAVAKEAAHLRETLDTYVAAMPSMMWESRGSGENTQTVYVNDYVETLVGYTPAEWISQPGLWWKLMHADDREHVRKELAELFERGEDATLEYRWIRRDGREIWVSARIVIVRDAEGRLIGRRGVTTDITRRKQAELERAFLQEELLRTQADAIAELSTPLVPISDDILVMPLVGRMDEARGDRAQETILQGLHATGARFVIIDITGVAEMNEHIAAGLLESARSASLLGAEAMLTGIRAEVARTLIAAGADLGGVHTFSTLQRGVAYAMHEAAKARRAAR
jgi:rsbT co-antagonist protein RsbR